MTGFGVLFQLQLRGMLCPCCFQRSNGEDANARQALTTVNRSCRRIQVRTASAAGSGNSHSHASSMGFLGNLFGSSGAGTSSPKESSPYLAKLLLRDSSDGQPELVIEPHREEYDEFEDEPSTQEQSSPSSRRTSARTIKLRRVDKVHLDGDEIVLQAKASRELVRFVVLQPGSQTYVTPDTRNLLVHHFMVLTEWERQRRAKAIPADSHDDSDDDDDAGASTNFITARAQKMAHFAQREIELQRTKKQREQRKAQLLQEAGGLKYTAMAMANLHAATSNGGPL